MRVKDYFKPPESQIPLVIGTIVEIENQLYVLARTNHLEAQFVAIHGQQKFMHCPLILEFNSFNLDKMMGMEPFNESEMRQLLKNCYNDAVVVGCFNHRHWFPIRKKV